MARSDGGAHAAGIRAAGAGDVDRRAVIGGGADERQPERDVHAAAERGDLDRRHADIVIRRQHGVELAAHRAHEDGIGGQRPGGTQTVGGRRQNARLLVAEESLLAGVRVEGAERQPRLGDAEPRREPVAGDLAGAHDPFGGEQQRAHRGRRRAW